MKKTNITIGIPAYNEEANIEYVLRDIMAQKQTSYKITEIIVVSDGSTDKTVERIINLNMPVLTTLDDGKRLGLGERENQIFKLSQTEILVLVQADISLKDKTFLEKLVSPIINNGVDLTAAALEETKGKTFVEKVLVCSMEMKKRIFEGLNNGNNVYTCHGPVRGFSKKLYKTLKLKTSIGEDGYSYLFCKFNNFTYQYVKSAKVTYKLPDNLRDHLRQSIRYETSKSIFNHEFDPKLIKESYNLNKFDVVKNLILQLIKNPILMSSYLSIAAYSKIMFLLNPQTTETWDIAISSKNLKRGIA